MPYDKYLSVLARLRIGLFVRGSRGWLSSKFEEQMALGKEIVDDTIMNDKEKMNTYDDFDGQFAYDDPYEMVKRLCYLLNKPDKLKELRKANKATFDRYLTSKLIIANVLDTIETGFHWE